jgi:hypothetical protein
MPASLFLPENVDPDYLADIVNEFAAEEQLLPPTPPAPIDDRRHGGLRPLTLGFCCRIAAHAALSPGTAIGGYEILALLASAEWVRSTGRTIRGLDATWR